jgi:hypothetical protein
MKKSDFCCLSFLERKKLISQKEKKRKKLDFSLFQLELHIGCLKY